MKKNPKRKKQREQEICKHLHLHVGLNTATFLHGFSYVIEEQNAGGDKIGFLFIC